MKFGAITTDLHAFCAGCRELEPVAILKELGEPDGYIITIITCKHYGRCKRIAEHIREGVKD